MTLTTTSGWLLIATLLLAGCPKKGPRTDPDAPIEVAPDVAAQDFGAADEPTSAKVDRAAALLTTGVKEDAARARDLLLRVVEGSPDDAMAHLNLGVAWYSLGDEEQAAAEFSRVTRLRPDLSAAWLYLGRTERELGDPESGLRRFQSGIEANPANVDLRVALVNGLRGLKRYTEAVDAARAAIKLNSRSLPVYNEMALVWMDSGQLEKARFVFEKAENIPGAENDASLQANFGWLLYQVGERYAAEFRLKKAVDLNPTGLVGLIYLGRLYADGHNWAAMVPLLETAVKVAPDHHGAFMDLGVGYRGLGRVEEARTAWQRALEIDPANPDPHFNIGVLLTEDLKKYDEAVKELQRYIEGGGTDAALAQTYIEQIRKETQRAEQRRKQDEERARREKERLERERLIQEAEKNPPPPEPGPGDPGTPPASPPTEAPTEAPKEEGGTESPWGPAPETPPKQEQP